jgi:TnpA family transposase
MSTFEVRRSFTLSSDDCHVLRLRQGWDELLRVAATIDEGWRSATDVLERFGSAARGDRIYRAGHALGQLLRTVYLCDYFALPDFRRPLYRGRNAKCATQRRNR